MVKSTSSITFFRFYPKGKHTRCRLVRKRGEISRKTPTKMVRFALFLLKYRYVFTCTMHKNKVNPMFKSSKLENQWIDSMLSDSLIEKKNLPIGSSWMVFKIPTTVERRETFLCSWFARAWNTPEKTDRSLKTPWKLLENDFLLENPLNLTKQCLIFLKTSLNTWEYSKIISFWHEKIEEIALTSNISWETHLSSQKRQSFLYQDNSVFPIQII